MRELQTLLSLAEGESLGAARGLLETHVLGVLEAAHPGTHFVFHHGEGSALGGVRWEDGASLRSVEQSVREHLSVAAVSPVPGLTFAPCALVEVNRHLSTLASVELIYTAGRQNPELRQSITELAELWEHGISDTEDDGFEVMTRSMDIRERALVQLALERHPEARDSIETTPRVAQHWISHERPDSDVRAAARLALELEIEGEVSNARNGLGWILGAEEHRIASASIQLNNPTSAVWAALARLSAP